jgi:hypothetical protein
MSKHQEIQIENLQLAKLIRLSERANHLSLVELEQNNHIIRLLRTLVWENQPPYLNSIHVQFSKGTQVPTPGPVTLTTAGQQVTASVVGFDQFGQPFTGELPPATLSSDDTAGAIVTFDPSTGLTTAVANGVANITASLTTAEGLSLTDTEAVTVAIEVVPPPTPVLSSIKVAF